MHNAYPLFHIAFRQNKTHKRKQQPKKKKQTNNGTKTQPKHVAIMFTFTDGFHGVNMF